MFKTLKKIKNWIVGIFAVIGGIAVVYALKKDSRSEKEFKADLKKIGTQKKQVKKNLEQKQKKVAKLKEEIKKNESVVADLEKQKKSIKVEEKSTAKKMDYLKKLANKGK